MDEDVCILSVSDVINLLGVSKTTVHRWIKEGKINALKVGSQYVIPCKELEKVWKGSKKTLWKLIEIYLGGDRR